MHDRIEPVSTFDFVWQILILVRRMTGKKPVVFVRRNNQRFGRPSPAGSQWACFKTLTLASEKRRTRPSSLELSGSKSLISRTLACALP